MWTFFSLCIASVLTAIVLLERRYCAASVTSAVRLATAYAWLTSFSIVALTPIDVWATLTSKPSAAIAVLWVISYWSTQVLTWLLLPFFQVYSDAGDFTIAAKCWTSLKENALLYGAAGVAGLVGVAFLIIFEHLTISNLMALGINLSNAFGLVVGILLLGYGLVEVPRHLWKSNPEQQLKWCAHRAGRFAEAVVKTTKELEMVITIICANQKQMPRRDPLRPYMDIIADYAEAESPVKPSHVAQRNIVIEQLSADDLEYNYDKQGLANLRRRLFHAIAQYKGAHSQYDEAIEQAFELQDICKCRASGEIVPPSGPVTQVTKAVWHYRCLVRPWWLRLVSLTLFGLSLLVIWTEATIFTGTHPDLSPFSRIILASTKGEVSTQILVLLPLAYICFCTYYALFSINAFDYNKLLPKSTTGAALMQNGSLMARFAAPTCWNFLYMIHMTGDVNGDQTVFSQKYTNGNLGAFARHLNVYLPIILFVHSALIALNLWDRIAASCVSRKFRFSETDDVDDEFTEKGRGLIDKERGAVLNGARIGALLHSDAPDVEAPGLGGALARGKNAIANQKRWFAFGRTNNKADKDSLLSEAPPSASTLIANKYRHGGRRSPAIEDQEASSGLLSKSEVHSDDTPTAASQGGLDGIFAEISKGTKATSTARDNRTATSRASGGGGLDPGAGDSGLGRWRLGKH